MSGEPGVPGERGPAGLSGLKGIKGDSGEVGVTYIRWGKKTCPNSGATLVYEGNIKIMDPVKSRFLDNYSAASSARNTSIAQKLIELGDTLECCFL